MAAEEVEIRQTTMAQLRNDAQPLEARLPMIRAGFSDSQGFELAQRAAKALAASTLVPKQYQGDLPNCLIALEMAQRIGASPLMVMQHLYIVQGKPAWSAVFLIASFNQCGRFSAIRYEWLGEKGKDSYGCRAWAIEKDGGQKIVGSAVTWAVVKAEKWDAKDGSKWKTMPDQMFMYRAASFFVKTFAPEISMGLSTAEELGDTYDAIPQADGSHAVTVEAIRAAAPVKATMSEDTAFDLIANAQSGAELQEAWKQIKAAIVPVPVELEAAFNDRLEAIAQKN